MYKANLIRRTIDKPEEKVLLLYEFLIANNITSFRKDEFIGEESGIRKTTQFFISVESTSQVLNVHIKTVNKWQGMLKEVFPNSYNQGEYIIIEHLWSFLFWQLHKSYYLANKDINEWIETHIKKDIARPNFSSSSLEILKFINQ